MLPAVLQRGLLPNRHTDGEIADAFGLNKRMTHRRLRPKGTTLRQELGRELESLQAQLPETTDLPVCDIAKSLGYSDSSSFIRAFRRWTGHSPTAWHKRTRLNGADRSDRYPDSRA
jgi:AraC-like DNA-binding protein